MTIGSDGLLIFVVVIIDSIQIAKKINRFCGSLQNQSCSYTVTDVATKSHNT